MIIFHFIVMILMTIIINIIMSLSLSSVTSLILFSSLSSSWTITFHFHYYQYYYHQCHHHYYHYLFTFELIIIIIILILVNTINHHHCINQHQYPIVTIILTTILMSGMWHLNPPLQDLCSVCADGLMCYHFDLHMWSYFNTIFGKKGDRSQKSESLCCKLNSCWDATLRVIDASQVSCLAEVGSNIPETSLYF